MHSSTPGLNPRTAIALALTTVVTGFLSAACQDVATNNPQTSSPTPAAKGLKIGSLLPATGDLSSIGQPMLNAVPLLVDTVNQCGGVNGEPVTLVAVDDQTDPRAGAEGMTKLTEVDQVAGVVGSFASSVSSAAVPIAVRNKVMLISPGSTSPVFTDRAAKGEFKGYWARTAPPDTYQAQALAKLAHDKGFKRVSTLVINNDYGVGFEKVFVAAFKKLGGTVINEANPTRYDPKATTFDTEAATAFANKPDAVIAVLYTETGSLLLKSAYEQGVSKGVQILLTDGVSSPDFPTQVGQSATGKFILAGALGTVPGADGKALADLSKRWEAKYNRPISPFVPHSWDATALLVLAAQAAHSNTGEGIQSKIREVANGPGEEVTDVCQGLELLRQGKDINYQGASSNVDLDANGDVVGIYDIWTVQDDGKIAVIGKVTPQ
ncbi:amino acid ABC transporter substrate-binding protein [Neosynechococcus sphagnicola sy1]|uniref:Amino acid ABC transporter substrate-binding protein n=1 Tax=Neosynechococcus sphagnicola sy1 TaxID=1497020 RepID=A0A098TMC4_9CYAN|nr:ABC transporter substrate-binding protein [Neosynechococcus sphagnicola]KGF73459.1 amino acid ABC transporter substrate-binding protein [Neosynechococcus sphagnicola sy1]